MAEAKRVWMPLNQNGCPLSHTFDMVLDNGEQVLYRFERNSSVMVAPEHLDAVLSAQLPDAAGRPFHPFTTDPPDANLSDADQLKMKVEAQDDQIRELKELVTSMLPGRQASEVNERLGIPEDQEPEEALSALFRDAT